MPIRVEKKREEQIRDTRAWLQLCDRLQRVAPEMRAVVFDECPKCQGDGGVCIVAQAVALTKRADEV